MNEDQPIESAVASGANPNPSLTRRRFLGSAGASAISLAILDPGLVGAAEANSKLELGLIGCGSRGGMMADLFRKHGGFNIAAVADYFPDKADALGETLGVPASRRYTGLSCHHKLLGSKLDAVVIESPPYFHPEHAAAAIEAGKHVFLAKPVAVDVPGCQTIAESARNATARKLVFLVDFQTRATPAYQEVVRRVREGQIGPIKAAEASYMANLTFEQGDIQFRRSARDATARLRSWGGDRVLSGEPITEQNIHALDVASWFLDAEPIKAVGAGGKARDYAGDCWDHFSVIFTYPNDVLLSFSSRQFGFAHSDIMCRIYGMQGTVDTHYGGKVWLRSKEEAFDADVPGMGRDGPSSNIAAFYKGITEGDYTNATVAPGVRSNLVTILGRAAAHKRGEVTWDEVLKANERLEFDTMGLVL